ncbi:MAG: hypothetical protein KJ601_06865 [Nanoarchaeota archaeon]|nr:hypothetical protein [Nanoarchaeota archaeon]
MNKKGLSFNATFGPIFAILTIVSMYIGLYYEIEIAFIIAGYLSILTGLVLLINTLTTKAYIGTIMAPIMWLCMVLLVAIGLALVYSPFNIIAKEYIPNFETTAFYSYIVILGLALIHIITGK